MKYKVDGQSLTAKEWKQLVKDRLEAVLKHDESIPWQNSSMLQGDGTREFYIYYTLHIAEEK